MIAARTVNPLLNWTGGLSPSPPTFLQAGGFQAKVPSVNEWSRPIIQKPGTSLNRISEMTGDS